MKRRYVLALFSTLIIASMLLAACGNAAEATEAPAAVATEAAATEAAATEVATPAIPYVETTMTDGLMALVAPDCDYGTADNPAKIKSIEAVDEYTVKFELCAPDPSFASKVAFSVFSIADKDYLDANSGDSVKMSVAPNGTGPYKVTAWNQGDSVVFEAYDNYWGDKALTKNLIFRWSEQSAQRLLELQSGTVDGIDNPAAEDFETISGDSTLALYDRSPLNTLYFGFNNTIAPFDNLNVRKAIAMGIDRERIVEQYLPAGSVVATSFVPDAINPGVSPEVGWYEYDPEGAKALLAEEGYTEANPLEITFTFRNVVRAYAAAPDKIAQEVQAQLAEIGVNVTIEEMESAAFIDATAAGEKGFFLLGWNADYPDATNFLDYHFANSANKQNGTLYQEIVDEINAAAQLSDAAARQAHYDNVNKLIKEKVVTIPVSHAASATAFKASVTGAHASPLGNEVFSVMSNGTDQLVWMQNAEPASLWCSDETDGETLRACEQVYEALLAFKVGTTEVEPALAESYTANEDATEWVFNLRQGVTYQDGATFEANDVVASYVALWDASSPNHVGRTGTFEYWTTYFGANLNVGY